MSHAEQLSDDMNLLKKKYKTKKAMARKMAKVLGRARSFDSFYQYFTRHTTGKKVGMRFFVNFYKIFREDIHTLQSKTGVYRPVPQTFVAIPDTFMVMSHCLEKIQISMEKIVDLQEVILHKLDGKPATDTI